MEVGDKVGEAHCKGGGFSLRRSIDQSSMNTINAERDGDKKTRSGAAKLGNSSGLPSSIMPARHLAHMGGRSRLMTGPIHSLLTWQSSQAFCKQATVNWCPNTSIQQTSQNKLVQLVQLVGRGVESENTSTNKSVVQYHLVWTCFHHTSALIAFVQPLQATLSRPRKSH